MFSFRNLDWLPTTLGSATFTPVRAILPTTPGSVGNPSVEGFAKSNTQLCDPIILGASSMGLKGVF